MGTNENAIERLHNLLCLFAPEEARYSVREISELTEVPVGVVRDDILALHKARELGVTFFPYKEEKNEEDILSALSSGKYDNVPLCCTYSGRPLSLSLTQVELECLREFLGQQEKLKELSRHNFAVKPYFNQSPASLQVKAAQMQEMISEGASVSMHYVTPRGEVLFKEIRPLELVHVEFDDLYYLVTVEEGQLTAYRLDRIRQFKKSDRNIPVTDRTPLDDLPNIWGMELGERVHVKIYIRNTIRVVEKVRRDLADRINGSWTPVGEDWIFEDDVIGINSFRSWVNSYGSAVLVLEPQSLREEIIASAGRRLEYYEGN